MSALPFRLLIVTDRTACAERARGVIETVARALSHGGGGVAVLVRDRGAAREAVRATCAALLPVVRRAGALLLVHGHLELVAALGLDGAHVDSRADVAAAREALPAGALLGASRHAIGELGEGGVPLDYATLSPIFAPSSKPGDTRARLGLGALRAAAELQRRASPRGPAVVALGGIDAGRARACVEAGAAAVAVLGDVMGAQDPAAATTALRDVLDLLSSRP